MESKVSPFHIDIESVRHLPEFEQGQFAQRARHPSSVVVDFFVIKIQIAQFRRLSDCGIDRRNSNDDVASSSDEDSEVSSIE